MNAALKLLFENKMTQRQVVEAFDVPKTTSAKAGKMSNAQTKKILIILLVVYVKIKFRDVTKERRAIDSLLTLVFCSTYCIRFINFCLPEGHRNRVVIIEARPKVVNDRRSNVKSQGHLKVIKIMEIVLLAVKVV